MTELPTTSGLAIVNTFVFGHCRYWLMAVSVLIPKISWNQNRITKYMLLMFIVPYKQACEISYDLIYLTCTRKRVCREISSSNDLIQWLFPRAAMQFHLNSWRIKTELFILQKRKEWLLSGNILPFNCNFKCLKKKTQRCNLHNLHESNKRKNAK